MTSRVDRPDLKHFVRIRGRRGPYVEFDYSVGSTDLSIELVMPEGAFREFCDRIKPSMITPEEAARIDREKAVWRHKQVDPEDDEDEVED